MHLETYASFEFFMLANKNNLTKVKQIKELGIKLCQEI